MNCSTWQETAASPWTHAIDCSSHAGYRLLPTAASTAYTRAWPIRILYPTSTNRDAWAFVKSEDTLQHTRSQRRRTSLPLATILPQWLPVLIRSEDFVETASRPYCCKNEHMASTSIYRQHLISSNPSHQIIRNRSCPSSSRNLVQPTDENRWLNRFDWTVIDHLHSPVQGLF